MKKGHVLLQTLQDQRTLMQRSDLHDGCMWQIVSMCLTPSKCTQEKKEDGEDDEEKEKDEKEEDGEKKEQEESRKRKREEDVVPQLQQRILSAWQLQVGVPTLLPWGNGPLIEGNMGLNL